MAETIYISVQVEEFKAIRNQLLHSKEPVNTQILDLTAAILCLTREVQFLRAYLEERQS